MLKIEKVTEPTFFSDFVRIKKPQNWDGFKEIREELRKFILANEQVFSGVSLCTYCERKVTLETSQIEHVKPKDAGKFPKLFDKYSNLTISCRSKNSCSQKKGSKYDSKFIHPIEDNPDDFLTFDIPTGQIVAKVDSCRERVKYTCEILGLNSSRELIHARKLILNKLFSSADKGKAIIGFEKQFPSLMKFYEEEFLS